MNVRRALLAAAVASFAALAATAPAAGACMGCEPVCAVFAHKLVVKVTHSDNCPVA